MKQVHTALVILLQCWEMLTGNLFLSPAGRAREVHSPRKMVSLFPIANRTMGTSKYPVLHGSSAGASQPMHTMPASQCIVDRDKSIKLSVLRR
jgi:hypothetical protein